MAGKHRLAKIYKGLSRKAKAAIVGGVLVTGLAGGTLAASAATSTTVVSVGITGVSQSELDFNGHGSYELQVVNQDTQVQAFHKKAGGLVKVTGLEAGTAYEWRTVQNGHWGLFTTAFTTAASGKDGLTGEPGATPVLNPTTAPTPSGLPKTIVTGGSALTNATDAEDVTLPSKGTYLVTVRAKVASVATVTATVYPQFFVYSKALDASWSGNLFNIGAGSLPVGNASIDNYYTGTSLVTVDAGTTLHVYAFGYDGDHGAGSYTLEDLAVEYIQVG